jgi:4-amino-4-deoxy-L-arabinose transferase-like glycosyltransferase
LLLLFVGSLLFHVAGTWTLPLVDRDEPRFAEASREMLERGDYVVPFLNDKYRFDKPPLTYWAHTVSYRIFGENDFAARFPSALAAAFTALLLFHWGQRIGGERLGWWAAIIFTICLQVFIHAKAAVADMWLVLFVTAAHWAGYELLRDRLGGAKPVSQQAAPQRRWWWLFYFALACGFLAKGPIAWTPLLTVAGAKFFLPEVKLNRRFLFTTGILFMLSIVAVWGIPALVRTEGRFFDVGIGKHVVARSVVAMEGHGGKSLWSYLISLPFYFVLLFVSFLPWSVKLPWLAKRLWQTRDPLDNYLLAGTAVVFVLFTLVKTKLPHYTLPAFPLLALLLAKALADLPNASRFVRRAAIIGALAALVTVCTTPFLRAYAPALQLVEQARPDLKPEMEFGAMEYKEPSLIWYFRKHVKGFLSDLDDDTIGPFMERPGGRFVVLPTSSVPEVFPAVPPEWKSYRAQGLNAAKGRWVDLTLLLKRE